MQSNHFWLRCQCNPVGEEQCFQQMVMEQLKIHLENVNLDPYLMLYINNFKWIMDLNRKTKTIKLPEENMKVFSTLGKQKFLRIQKH